MKNSLKEAQSLIKNLIQEKNNQERNNDKLNNEITVITQKYSGLENELRAKKTDIQIHLEEIKKLDLEIENRKNELRNFISNKDVLVKDLENKNEKLKFEISSLSQKYTNLEYDFKHKSSSAERYNSEIQKLILEIENYKKELSNYISTKNELEKEININKIETSKLNEIIDEYKKSDKNELVKDLESKNEKLKVEISSIAQKYINLQNEFKLNNSKAERYHNEIQKLLLEIETSKSDFKNINSNKDRSIKDLESKNEKLKFEISSIAQKYSNLEHEFKSKNNSEIYYKEIQKLLLEIETSKSDFKNINSNKDKSIKDLEYKNDNLKNRISQVQDENLTFFQELSDQKVIMGNLNKIITEKNIELKERKRKGIYKYYTIIIILVILNIILATKIYLMFEY